MARRKKGGDSGGGGGGDWLNTYADMVTLLLTFFILLFSMSSLDSAKFNMLVTAFASDGESSDVIIIRGEATGKEQSAQQAQTTDTTMEEIAQILQEMITAQNLEDSIEVESGEGYVFIRFKDDMLFEPNSAVLRPRDQELLNFIGVAIKEVQTSAAAINIVGHTAAIPDNPDYAVSDRLLSTERANRVLMYFEDDVGIDGSKLFATGYGKWKEIAPNTTPEGQARNRRVEILISSENNSLSEQLDNVYEKLVE